MAKSRKTPLNEFGRRLVDEMHLTTRANPKLMQERYEAFLLDEERPEHRTPAWTFTRREEFCHRIFRQYGEIEIALSRFELAGQFLVRLHPQHATAEIISYHVEKHIEEGYIVKERIVGFLRHLTKLVKRRGLQDDLRTLGKLEKIVEEAFEGIVRARGEHIHKMRFQDEDIKRIGTLELLTGSGGLRHLEPLKRLVVLKTLKKWRRTTRGNAKEMRKAIEKLVMLVQPIVFDKLAPPDPTPSPS